MLIYVVTALILPLIIVKISESKWFLCFLKYISYKSIYDNILDAAIDRDKRTLMCVYLKDSNVFYIGTCKFYEEKGMDSHLILIDYASYDVDTMKTVIDTKENNLKASVIISLQNIERIELFYENDSKVWKRLNDNIEMKSE